VSRGIFNGWAGVFSSGLIVEEYLSKYGLRNRLLLGTVLIFHWCFTYIQRICFVTPHLRISVQDLIIINNICHFEKN
jgi:hypothetical protein